VEHNSNLCGEVLTRFGSDKDTAHSYGMIYEQLFRPRRMDLLTILEVGVLNGNSLLAWESYFPNAVVFGAEKDPELVRRFNNDPSRKTGERKKLAHAFCCDTTIPEHCEMIAGVQFSIIIDDGSHWKDDQAATLNNLWPMLAPGGIYIIEDVQHLEWAEELVALRPGGEIRDLRSWKNRPDDILVIWSGGSHDVQ